LTSMDGMPPVETVQKGKRWFRVYWNSKHPTRFSTTPMHEKPWRFSPFIDHHTGEIVQALYMGDSAMGAMAETIFRKDSKGALLCSQVDDRYLCQLTSMRNLQVAVLTEAFLQAKIGYNPILDNDYPRCRDIAALLYHLSPVPLDGLAFPSYQTDAHNVNLMVFSSRVKPSDFRVVPRSKGQVYGDKYKLEFRLAVDASKRLLSDALVEKLES